MGGDGALLALAAGFGGGVVLGLAARMARFCALGAIEDAIYGGEWLRARMWALAAAVAMAGAFALEAAGAVDLTETRYLATAWVPLASIAGGLAFGYGMALVGTCPYGALARLGGGDLRSLLMALVIGVSGYAAGSGVLAAARMEIFPVERVGPGAPQGLAHALEALAGIPAPAVGLTLAAALAWIALSDGSLLAAPRRLAWSAAAGLAIVSGWAATAWIARTSFTPVAIESHSFVAPTGETVLWLMAATGTAPGFAVGSVGGVVVGAALGALWRGEFRWEACDEPRELRRQILGAALMGVGGIVAVGCTVGQGLAATSTFAFSAPEVVCSIIAGAWAGLRALILLPIR